MSYSNVFPVAFSNQTSDANRAKKPAVRLRPIAQAVSLTLMASLWHAGNAIAQDSVAQNAEPQLDLIQVSAQRGNDTNTVVRANRISVEQALGLGDLFKQTPEVSVGGGGLFAAQKLYVRGMAERMLSISIDGATQNESPYHHSAQVLIDPQLLKRVEIEAGTGAATAGPGALAGALRFTTKSASDLLRQGERAGGWLQADTQSANRGLKLSATAFAKLNEELDILLTSSRLHSQDYRAGDGQKVANTAVNSNAQFLKLDFKPNQHHRLQLGVEQNSDEGWRNQRSNLQWAEFNLAQQQKMQRLSSTLNYHYEPESRYINLEVSAYSNENSVKLAQNLASREKVGARAHGLNLLNISRFADHKISTGLNYRQDKGYAHLPDADLADEKASVVGIFVQDDWVLADQWMLVAGARYDQYRYDYLDSSMQQRRINSSGFSPSASLSYLPNDNLSLRLNYATALRGIGILEPYLKQYQENAADLQAEKANTLDLSAQWQDGPWRASASMYRQKISNYVGYDDFRQNLGQVKVTGYTASLGFQAKRWSASLGVSHAKPSLNGQALSSGDAFLLGNAAGRTWVAQLDYQMPAQHLNMGATARLIERLNFLPTDAQAKPGYAVMDVYAQWLPLGKEDLRINFGIKNIFNKFYYDQSSFGFHPRWQGIAALPEVGRDLRLSAAWRF